MSGRLPPELYEVQVTGAFDRTATMDQRIQQVTTQVNRNQ
jgi:hypothetical protein